MSKLAIVATIKTAPGTRDEYLKELVAHRERCRVGEPGTLQFEVLAPHEEPDTIMLFEIYADEDALKAHMTGDSFEQIRRNTAGIHVSLSGIPCHLAG